MRGQIKILGVKIDNITMKGAVERVGEMIKEGGKPRKTSSRGKHHVVTPNPEHLVMAQEDEEFKRILNSADLAIPDGTGLVWAGGLKERVTGTDLMINLCREATQKNWSVFFLGGEEGVAQQAAAQLQAQFPGLKVAGASSFDPDLLVTDYQLLITSSDLLFVAYGAPTQEKWIAKHLSNLPVKVAIGVGGAFDFVVGKQKRAPRIFRRLGLEWFWRLVTQPWRWRRQTRLIRFVWLVISDVLK